MRFNPLEIFRKPKQPERPPIPAEDLEHDLVFEKEFKARVLALGGDWQDFRPTGLPGGVYPIFVPPDKAQLMAEFLNSQGFTGGTNESAYPFVGGYHQFETGKQIMFRVNGKLK